MFKLFAFFKKFFPKLIGKNYRVNFNSKEIHKLRNEKHNCFLNAMTDYKNIYQKDVDGYLNDGFNGCKWCYHEKNTG